MSKKLTVLLSSEHHRQLTQMVRKGTASARVITRARILLMADKGEHQNHPHTYEQIQNALGCCVATISHICRSYVQEGLEAALQEKPRPGAKPKITGEVEAYLTMIACSEPPEGKARWTMQMLADKLVEVKMLDSITDSAVCARLKKVRSNPGRSDATA